MRLGLIADIHADPRALDGALRGLEVYGVDQILCAGDLVGYGGQPDAVVALLRDRAIPCIRGNHDRWALERGQVIGPQGWKRAVLKDETWEYLHALPASARRECAGRILVIHHGSPESDTEFVTPYKPLPESVEHFWNTEPADVLVLGHTHIAMIDRGPRGMIVNPGSVLGVPGVQTSYSFAIVDLNDLSVRIVDIRTGREIHRDPVFLGDEDPQG
jgi:putative phosphoesterase